MSRYIILTSLLFNAFTAIGQEISNYDKNDNDSIEEPELLKFFLDFYKEDIKLIDVDRNYTITNEELRNRYFADLISFKEEYGEFPVLMSRVEEEYLKKKETKSWFENTGVLIRSEHDDITLYKRAENRKKADPAIINYTRNNKDTTAIWTLQGALIRPFRITKPWKNFRLAIVPSIYFNRKISSNNEGEVNNLIFRMGVNAEWVDSNGKYSINVRLNHSRATDFDFNTDVRATELDIEPIGGQVSKRLLGSIEYKWRFYVHTEIGTNKDIGNSENLEETDFFRLGARAELELQLGSGLEFKSKFGYLYGFSGEPENSELINLKLIHKLDTRGHLTLNLEYQKGNLPLLQQEVDNWTFGLGIKF